jgi:7,8-dihydroneopterin aldolase/epimerase/oxygenase
MPSYLLSIADMSFYAYHGFYAEERQVGGWFKISVELNLNLDSQSNFTDLSNTVNYEEIHSLVAQIMKTPQALIESVCKDIFDKIYETYPSLIKLRVRLEKLNPPMKKVGKTSFEISESRN